MKLGAEAQGLITTANSIIDGYAAQGLDLTLRQIYYQFVSRDLIPNTEKSYKKLGDVISNGRLAGFIDWSRIKDRGRHSEKNSHWDSPAQIIETCATSYQIDKWAGQKTRCEVWIEKDALSGVLDACCPGLDVPYFACKGYVSQSSMWEAAMRIVQRLKEPGCSRMVILHLGDHDPSGIDMSRDISDRLGLLSWGADIEVKRIALNMDQIEQYEPPPNPAKLTDTRAEDYIAKFGTESWELDALEPNVLIALITKEVKKLRNEKKWKEQVEIEAGARELLQGVADNWSDVVKNL
jgi:hypothetical protein